MLYFFAALIVSLEYFVFYQFIAPPDFVANAIGQLTTALKDSQVNSDMLDSLSNIRISPIHMAIQGIFNNVFYGIMLSIPVAALSVQGTIRLVPSLKTAKKLITDK